MSLRWTFFRVGMKVMKTAQIGILFNLALDIITFLLIKYRRVPASAVLRQKTINH